MMRLFTTQFGIAKKRMSIAAYADNAPVASNKTAAGRARNRRVDIVVLNEVGRQGEPPPMKAAQKSKAAAAKSPAAPSAKPVAIPAPPAAAPAKPAGAPGNRTAG